MPESLLSLITLYAVNRTAHSEQHMLERFAQHPDNCINYILRTALPVEYCYDGLKHTFSRIEESDSSQLICTFWYLSDGESSSAALRFSAESVQGEIHYRYTIIPATGFPTFDNMDKESQRFLAHLVSNHKWPKWTAGEIQP